PEVAVLPKAAAPSQSTTTKLASVQVLSDRLLPLEGIAVRLVASTAAGSGPIDATTVTDSDGQTPWIALDTANGVEVVLTETSTAAGIALGMIEDVVPPAF